MPWWNAQQPARWRFNGRHEERRMRDRQARVERVRNYLEARELRAEIGKASAARCRTCHSLLNRGRCPNGCGRL